jgi:hypothetical protein
MRRNRDMPLSKEAEELLVNVWELGVVNVWAHNLVPAADLVRAGFVEARDDAEGPWLGLTDRGRRYINIPAPRARA